MRITNWCKKLAAGLVAAGLMTPVAISPTLMAADLDTNLVVNPGFESVDINSSEGGYNAVEILNWTDGSAVGFAYSHDGSLDGAGATIPDYANGGVYTGGMAPAGTGSFYFTSNATPGDITGPGQVSQDIDLSSGATGSLIPGGEAAALLSGYFSGFSTNGDLGTLHVNFLNSSGASVGEISVTDSDPSNWTLESTASLIPADTASAQVSVFGTPLSGGPDGYIDNVDVQITAAENFLLFLEVDASTGESTFRNNTGETVRVDYYEIVSAGDSLNSSGWSSLQDQNAPGFPAGNGSGNGWEEAGGSDEGVLSESFLTGASAVADQSAIGLGSLFEPGEAQDLVFRYSVVSGEATTLEGDYNGNGIVDAADYTVWRDSLGDTVTPGDGADGDNSGAIDAADFAVWKSGFGESAGASGPGELVTGFVRYVTSGQVSAASVPEPTTFAMICLGSVGILSLASRRTPRTLEDS